MSIVYQCVVKMSRGHILLAATALIVLACAIGAECVASERPEDALLRAFLERLEGKKKESEPAYRDPLLALDRYPLTATTAFVLFGNDVNLLRSIYPRIESASMGYFSPSRLSEKGLVVGAKDESLRPGNVLSPALNALAALELWSLHMIAWKIGANEEALEFLASSRRLSAEIENSLYDPEEKRFHRSSADGRTIAEDSPANLLPLVLRKSLSKSESEKIIRSFLDSMEAAKDTTGTDKEYTGLWQDPLARPFVLEILSSIPVEGAILFSTLSPSLERSSISVEAPQDLWLHFWKSHPVERSGLFPAWRSHATLENLISLLEQKSLALQEELVSYRASLDTIAKALASDSLSIEQHRIATSAVNNLLSRLTRYRELVDLPKERWRVADEAKWVRLSPRTKRLVLESCKEATEELQRLKTSLAERLERGTGISFALLLPESPVIGGEPIKFRAIFRSQRSTLSISNARILVNDRLYSLIGPETSLEVAPGEPITFDGEFSLPSGIEPGIEAIEASFDFLSLGGRVEIRNDCSIAIAAPPQVTLELPKGRILWKEALPILIHIPFRTDHDLEGTVSGALFKEFTTTPKLPARFIARSYRDRTDLEIIVSSKEHLAPGRYPFSLSISLGGNTLALLEDEIIRPIRWLHLGPLRPTDRCFKNANSTQSDLFESYALSDGSNISWVEIAKSSLEEDGSICFERIYERNEGCCLLYTAINAEEKTKVRWLLRTEAAVTMWLNGVQAAIEPSSEDGPMQGTMELRKGPNSILLACCFESDDSCLNLSFFDESGSAVSGIDNELENIIEGFERIGSSELAAKKWKEPKEKLRSVTFTLDKKEAREVSVIGSFNNWDPGATRMKRNTAGLWQATVLLEPGRYSYKFLINRKTKIVDPANKTIEADGFGAFNSVLVVE